MKRKFMALALAAAMTVSISDMTVPPQKPQMMQKQQMKQKPLIQKKLPMMIRKQQMK